MDGKAVIIEVGANIVWPHKTGANRELYYENRRILAVKIMEGPDWRAGSEERLVPGTVWLG